MREPDLRRWEQEGAMRALVQLARDLPTTSPATAQPRLARLTAEQRAIIDRAMRRLLRET